MGPDLICIICSDRLLAVFFLTGSRLTMGPDLISDLAGSRQCPAAGRLVTVVATFGRMKMETELLMTRLAGGNVGCPGPLHGRPHHCNRRHCHGVTAVSIVIPPEYHHGKPHCLCRPLGRHRQFIELSSEIGIVDQDSKYSKLEDRKTNNLKSMTGGGCCGGTDLRRRRSWCVLAVLT